MSSMATQLGSTTFKKKISSPPPPAPEIQERKAYVNTSNREVQSHTSNTSIEPPPEASPLSRGSSQSSFYMEPPPLIKRESSQGTQGSLSSLDRSFVHIRRGHRRVRSSIKAQRSSMTEFLAECETKPPLAAASPIPMAPKLNASAKEKGGLSPSKLVVKPRRHTRNKTTDLGALIRGRNRDSNRHMHGSCETDIQKSLAKKQISNLLLRDVGAARSVSSKQSDYDVPSPSKRREATTAEIFNEIEMERVIRKMRLEVGVSAQYYKFKKYKESISGGQIIDWLLETKTVMNEEQALELGTLFNCWKYIHTVEGNKLNMSRNHLFRYTEEGKLVNSERKMLQKWSDYDKAKQLARAVFKEIPEKIIVIRFRRCRGISGAAILNWLRVSSVCPYCKSDEDATILGTLLLIHHLMSEVKQKEDTYKMAPDRFYSMNEELNELSMMDNPLLTARSIDTKGSSLSAVSQTPNDAGPRSSKVDNSPTSKLEFFKGIEGWMERKSKLGLWKKRYFRLVLRDRLFGSYLGYSMDEKEGAQQKGLIPLVQISSVTVDGRLIKLKMSSKHKGKTSYFLRCKRDEDATKWAGSLQPFVKASTVRDVLDQSILQVILSQEQLRHLEKAMKLRTFYERTWIQRVGKEPKCFCLLHTGKIGVYVTDREDNRSEKLLTYQTPVSFFGESLFAGNTCPTSIRAETEVTCAVLERKTLLTIMKKYPGLLGQVLDFMGDGILSMLQKVEFLSSLPIEDLEILRRGLHCTAYQAEQIVFYEGDIGEQFYMIYKGSVNVERKDLEKGGIVKVTTLNKGNYFGEIALIMDVGRTASIIVNEPTILLSINKRTFQSFLDMAGLDLRSVMRARIIETFKKFEIPFFKAIPDEKFAWIAGKCNIERFDKGEIIFKEGETGNNFYIISYGLVRVSKEGKVIARLSSGKYFGEIALVIENALRTATCTTCVETVLLSMSREDFNKSFESNPEALADVELKLAGKASGIRAILHHPMALKAFTKFLEDQFASESVICWQECLKFRNFYQKNVPETKDGVCLLPINEEKREEMLNWANTITSRFIRVGSELEVNIPDTMRRLAIKAVDAKEVFEDTFFDIETEIVGLMRNDKLSMFKNTEAFKNILKSVGSYLTVDMNADFKNKIKTLTRRSSMKLRSGSTTTRRSVLKQAIHHPDVIPEDEIEIVSQSTLQTHDTLLTKRSSNMSAACENKGQRADTGEGEGE